MQPNNGHTSPRGSVDSPADPLGPSAGGGSVFDHSLFIALTDLPADPRAMPPEQWQEALGRRLLTPQEQIAREHYFERRVAEALARVREGR